MTVSYRFSAHTSDGRNIAATFTTDAPIPADREDTYLLPGQGGFTCTGCTGFHFLRRPSHDIIQFNDRRTGDAFSYAYPLGTFQQFGSYVSRNVGSGLGNLDVVDLSPHPVTLRSTMDQSSGRSWAFGAGITFAQRFKAKEGGIPTELGVRMGNNQTPYSVHLRLAVDGVGMLARTYTGLVQRRSDWATVFDISGITARIPAGAWVTVSLTPDTEIGIEPIFSHDPEVPQGELARYGSMAARFYMSGTSWAA